ARPLARALLPGRVEYLVDERRSVGVLEGEDVARDLDEVAPEVAFVPPGEDVAHLARLHAQYVPHDLVDLADELHVPVLDAVVHHLHEMARAVLADPVAAGRAVHLGRYRLEDRPDGGPGLRRAARHDGRAEEGALLAAGYAGPDEEQAPRFDVVRP